MGIERVSHYIDNVLTEAQARMGLRDTRLLVTWYTNRENKQSVVHSHPYHELVLPIGGSTVRYSVDGSVYLVHVGELVYFPSQVYHSGNFNIDDDQSDRLVVQIDDALWQATRRRVNLKNTGWLQQLTVWTAKPAVSGTSRGFSSAWRKVWSCRALSGTPFLRRRSLK